MVPDPPDSDAPAAGAMPVGRATSTRQAIVSVRHWAERLLSFRITRPPGWAFTAGLYARLGLADGDGEVVWRPFSMTSAPAEPELEFLATLVPGGTFSSRLERAVPGAPVLLDANAYGFLTVGRLAPGTDLWMLATGSGVGPFRSMLLDPDVCRGFDTLVLAHSVRKADELVWRDDFAALAPRLRYLPIVTREAAEGCLHERIPALLDAGRLEAAAGVTLDVARSRVLACGNPGLEAELRPRLAARGFETPRRGRPGQLAFEQYWSPRGR